MRRTCWIWPVLVAAIPIGIAVRPALSAVSEEAPQRRGTTAAEPAIAFWPTPPPPLEVRRQLLLWSARFDREMAPILQTWQQILASLREFHLFHLEDRCGRFDEALSRLDSAGLFPSPDPIVDLHLGDLLAALEAAARICSRRHYFEVGHRLEEAGRSLRRIEDELERGMGTATGELPPTCAPAEDDSAGDSAQTGDALRRPQE